MKSSLQSSPTNPKPTVFIVDDDPDMHRLVAAVARDAGYNCEVFCSAEKFLEKMDFEAAGCLLLDIRMPGMKGPELQSILVEKGSQLPIVFISGTADVPTAVKVFQRGAIDLVEKPCKPATILYAIQQAIARDSVRRAELAEVNELRLRMDRLSPREREVAGLIANGNSSREIAAALGLSERTVEIHRSRAMAKMETDSIAVFAIQWARLIPKK